MATLFFLKEGKRRNGDRLTRSVEVDIDKAARALGAREHRHSKKPPTINPEVIAGDFGDYKYVVLEVSQAETRPPFGEPGYYWMIGLSPASCEEKMGLTPGSNN